MDRFEALKAMVENPDKEEELSKVTSAAEARALFNKHGIELNAEESESLEIKAGEQMEEELELSEEDLDAVAGGAPAKRQVVSRKCGCIRVDYIYKVYSSGFRVLVGIRFSCVW